MSTTRFALATVFLFAPSGCGLDLGAQTLLESARNTCRSVGVTDDRYFNGAVYIIRLAQEAGNTRLEISNSVLMLCQEECVGAGSFCVPDCALCPMATIEAVFAE